MDKRKSGCLLPDQLHQLFTVVSINQTLRFILVIYVLSTVTFNLVFGKKKKKNHINNNDNDVKGEQTRQGRRIITKTTMTMIITMMTMWWWWWW